VNFSLKKYVHSEKWKVDMMYRMQKYCSIPSVNRQFQLFLPEKPAISIFNDDSRPSIINFFPYQISIRSRE
jgi:hypothetical protein